MEAVNRANVSFCVRYLCNEVLLYQRFEMYGIHHEPRATWPLDPLNFRSLRYRNSNSASSVTLIDYLDRLHRNFYFRWIWAMD
jgi:hypothetical protein